ncbi:hypothetical protein [Candidatus Methylobacter oryzae]|uniref:Uncharacterized protein n=1 Tax=Candidatus Methylobacter oryzae TaxID=2497749 RepID=A0ABY3C4P7_9GAMM|nr:hypothetical protein [Candidatus Methylobacter oryzae]TRW89710.1 hypothetical protein EKO24_021935 [Candidatus Methylobacter oryzae]
MSGINIQQYRALPEYREIGEIVVPNRMVSAGPIDGVSDSTGLFRLFWTLTFIAGRLSIPLLSASIQHWLPLNVEI